MYCDFYHLSEKPFNVTPDPRFLYLNARYRETLAALHYGIAERKGFITLIGEAGTGKTTLLNRLLEEVDPKTKTVLIFNTHVTFEEILEYIFSELDLPVHSGKKLYMLQRLNAFLLEELRNGGNVALLLDEAQDLDIAVLEDLRLLSNLETAKEKILQIVIAGQPELEQKLSNPTLRQLRQRIAVNCRLQPLTRDELAEYIQFRLHAAGCPDPKVFTRDGEDQVWHFSRGIPRLVNVVCDNALVIGYALGKNRIGADLVTEAAGDLLAAKSELAPIVIDPAPTGHVDGGAVASEFAMATPPARRRRETWAIFAIAAIALLVGLASVGRSMWRQRSTVVPAAGNSRSRAVIHPGVEGGEDPPAALDAGRADFRTPAPRMQVPQERPRPEPEPIVPTDAGSTPPDAATEPAAGTAPLGLGEPVGESSHAALEAHAPPGAEAAAWRLPAMQPSDHREARGEVAPGKTAPPSLSAVPVEPGPPVAGHTAQAPHDLRAWQVPEAVSHGPAVGAAATTDRGGSSPGAIAFSTMTESTPAAGGITTRPAAPIAAASGSNPTPREASVVSAVSRSVSVASAGNIQRGAAPGGRSGMLATTEVERVVVKDGDSLGRIAARKYGQSNYTILDLVKLANPELTDVDRLSVGQVVALPRLGDGFPIVAQLGGTFGLVIHSTPITSRAATLADALRGRGFRADVVAVSIGQHKTVQRVVVGPTDSEQAAGELSARLQRAFRADESLAEMGRYQ